MVISERPQQLVVGLALCLLAVVSQAHAQEQLYVRDSFTLVGDGGGYEEKPLQGQNPIVVPGFTGKGSGPWNTEILRYVVQPESLFAEGYPDSLGGSVRYLPVLNERFATAVRRMDDYTPSATYYMNVLVNPGTLFLDGSNRVGHALVGFTNPFDEAAFRNDPEADDVFGALIGFAERPGLPLAPPRADLVLRSLDPAGDFADLVLVPDVSDTTFQVVVKIDVNANYAFDRLTYWVNPVDVSDEEAMTKTSLVTDTVASLALRSPKDIEQLSVVTDSWSRDFSFDEAGFSNDLRLLFAPILRCDLNSDGTVDASDMGIVFANWGNSGIGDINGDGVVDAADAGICFAEWTGDTGSTADSVTHAVPEMDHWCPLVGLLAAAVSLQRPARRVIRDRKAGTTNTTNKEAR